jgi:hypothetical protein
MNSAGTVSVSQTPLAKPSPHCDESRRFAFAQSAGFG